MKIRNIMKTKKLKDFVIEVGLDLTNETKSKIIDKVINENKSSEELKRAAETIGLDLTIVKINEFVDSFDFIELKKNLHYETSHLSAPHQMKSTKSYQEIIKYGNVIVPILMNDILNEDSSIVFYLILGDIVGDISIPKDDEGNLVKIRKCYREWWEMNKIN